MLVPNMSKIEKRFEDGGHKIPLSFFSSERDQNNLKTVELLGKIRECILEWPRVTHKIPGPFQNRGVGG